MTYFLRVAVVAAITILLFTGCKTTGANAPDTQSVAQGRVHVLLTTGTQPDALLEPFADYSFSIIGPASRSENKHAYTYNSASIEAEKLVIELMSHALVLEAKVMK